MKTYDVIKNEILSYLHYKEDWDGYGGIIPKEETVKDALHFLQWLNDSCVKVNLTPGLAGDGEISFFFKMEHDAYIDIGFRGEGTYSLFIRTPSVAEYVGSDISLKDKKLLDNILVFFREIEFKYIQ